EQTPAPGTSGLSLPEAEPESPHGDDDDGVPRLQRMARLTVSGAVVGTPAYMSLEQHEARTIDERSDQYSFCVSLYEALYGSRPYDADDISSLRELMRSSPPASPPRASGVPD